MIIAIDGPAGAGKSSTAKLVAQKLGIFHLDTGAMYRALTLKCLQHNVLHTDINSLSNCVKNTSLEFKDSVSEIRLWMDGRDITKDIRSENVTKHVSDYCKPLVIRDELVNQQREIGNKRSVVCEGRDIGTVVFPKAELKFFMVASVEKRANRRQKDFKKIGIEKSIEELIIDIEARDKKDSTRSISPLLKAEDAIELDTTNFTLEEQVTYIVNKAKEYINLNK